MDKKLTAELKSKLETQKKSLENQLESFATPDPKLKHNWETKYPAREDTDKEEAADDAQEYENMVALEHSLELKLKDVVMALEKVENGTYGICEKCGKKIDEERLLACPEAKTCLKCHLK